MPIRIPVNHKFQDVSHANAVHRNSHSHPWKKRITFLKQPLLKTRKNFFTFKDHPYSRKKSATWSRSMKTPERKLSMANPHDLNIINKMPDIRIEEAVWCWSFMSNSSKLCLSVYLVFIYKYANIRPACKPFEMINKWISCMPGVLLR